ncbi:hypothetical protein JVU11DRAFT_12920 [Chiua virens]|nr:hypothetical protein JVU11DRAFT_12920 [Chiua virens]
MINISPNNGTRYGYHSDRSSSRKLVPRLLPEDPTRGFVGALITHLAHASIPRCPYMRPHFTRIDMQTFRISPLGACLSSSCASMRYRKWNSVAPSSLIRTEPECVEEGCKQDSELRREIVQHKKIARERDIKLTIVLLASRKAMIPPWLPVPLFSQEKVIREPLSSVSPTEFVRCIILACHRHSQTLSSPLIPIGTASPSPLHPEGWTACFAEFRGKDEVALKYGWLYDLHDHIKLCYRAQTMDRSKGATILQCETHARTTVQGPS